MPDRRVLLDDRALLGGQGTGLAEDRVGDDDLAEVVEERAAPHVRARGGIQAHAGRDAVGVLGDPAAVPGRVRVARIDRLGEREDDVLGVLVLVGELLEHDERRTRGTSSSGEKGLERKSVTPSACARIFSAGDVVPVSMTTGRSRVAGSARICFEDLVAAAVGKLQIEQNEVGRIRSDGSPWRRSRCPSSSTV